MDFILPNPIEIDYIARGELLELSIYLGTIIEGLWSSYIMLSASFAQTSCIVFKKAHSSIIDFYRQFLDLMLMCIISLKS